MEACRYERVELCIAEDTEFVKVIRPDGGYDTVYPFKYQPVKISYDEEGIERTSTDMWRYANTEDGRAF